MKHTNSTLKGLFTVTVLLGSLAAMACDETPSAGQEQGTAPAVQVNLTADEYCSMWAEQHRAEICEQPENTTEHQATADPAAETSEPANDTPASDVAPSPAPAARKQAPTPTAAPQPKRTQQRRIVTGL